MVDCHVHSNFSGDSEMDPDAACLSAIKQGLLGISFTDHLDYDYPGYDEYFYINFDQYSLYMDALQKKYAERIKVLKGIEVGIQPHVIADSLKIIEKYDFDVVIASVHIVDKKDLHNGDFSRDKTQKEAYRAYLQEVLNMVKTVDNFDILGHMDLIRRYGSYSTNTLSYNEYADVIDSILKALIQKGKSLEVNASGYRYKLNSTLPDYDILKRFKELGGENVCFSSDAHFPQHIAYKFDVIRELVKKAGFRYSVYYEKRKAVHLKL